jgi:hypothetical protein
MIHEVFFSVRWLLPCSFLRLICRAVLPAAFFLDKSKELPLPLLISREKESGLGLNLFGQAQAAS